MKLCLALLLAALAQSAVAARQSIEIRVRLKKAQTVLDVSGFALSISKPSNFISVAAPPLGLAQAKIRQRRPGVWLVQWEGGQKLQRIESAHLWIKGQMLRVGVEPVPYDLEIQPNAKAGFDVVARLDLEKYLAGVLPSEMPAAWPLEALKAQVVAARSYVLRNAFERRGQAFDVDSTITDQVYKFLRDSEDHAEWQEKVRRAVHDTRGEVLLDGRNRILKAFYSADGGCTTEDPKFVWGPMDALQSVRDPTCTDHAPTIWRLILERAEVRRRLIVGLNLPAASTLRTLLVGGRTPSGRVYQVVASMNVDGRARTVVVNSQEFRRIFGFNRIRSTDFGLRWWGEQLEIAGQGVGHGVGLSQTGAHVMANSGADYRQILKRYYPKAQLRTLKRT